jgi:hypothetical protein
MNTLDKIADIIMNKVLELEKVGIRPAYVIVGCLEYDLLIEDMKNHPVMLTSSKGGITIFDMPIIPDFESTSCIKVTYEISIRNERLRMRKEEK